MFCPGWLRLTMTCFDHRCQCSSNSCKAEICWRYQCRVLHRLATTDDDLLALTAGASVLLLTAARRGCAAGRGDGQYRGGGLLRGEPL